MWLKRVQLGDEFRLEMNSYIEEEYRRSASERNDSSWAIRKIILFFCRFNMFDLEHDVFARSDDKPRIKRGLLRQTNYLELDCGDVDREPPKRGWSIKSLFQWPVLFMCAYLTSVVYLSIGVYYHYIHDQYVFHVDRLRQAQEHNKEYILADYMINNVTLSMLIDRAQETRKQLKSFGAPFLYTTYASECCLICLISSSFFCYVCPMIYRKFIDKIDFYMLRVFLDRKRVLMDFNETIRRQCNKYILNHCNFTEALISRCVQLNGLKSINLATLDSRSELRQLLLDYRNTIHRLKEFALYGQFQPMNSSSQWTNLLVTHYSWLVPTLVVLSEGFFVVVFFTLPRMLNYMHETDPADLLSIFFIEILWFALDCSAIFYITSSIFNCVDQMNLIDKLIEAMRACIKDNNFIYYEMIRDKSLAATNIDLDETGQHDAQLKAVATTHEKLDESLVIDLEGHQLETFDVASKHGELMARMNENLMFVLMHYKIFVSRLRGIQRHFNMLCLTSLYIIFVMPLIGRLHVPYVTMNVKYVLVATSLVSLFFADVCLAPICSLHAKCLYLYKIIWALLTHTIELTNDNNQLSRIYDKHTIWMLRKELNHPDRLVRQFATVVLGIKFTYSNLMKIHFWFGLIVLSILTDVRSEQEEMIGSLASDPLRIFSTNLA